MATRTVANETLPLARTATMSTTPTTLRMFAVRALAAVAGTAPTVPANGVTSAGNASANSLSVTIPSGVAAGDIMYLLVVGTTEIPSLPAGWTAIDSSATAPAYRLCWRAYVAGDGNPTSTVTTLGPMSGAIICVRGAANPGATTADRVTGTSFSTTTATFPVGNLAAGTDGLNILFGATRLSTNASITWSTAPGVASNGYTQDLLNGSSTPGRSLVIAHKYLTGGQWTLTGTWAEAAVPTSADDVVTDASSTGTLHLNASSACRSLTIANGVAWTLAASTTLTIGDGSGGAMNLTGMGTYTRGGSAGITFAATADNGGAGWPITSAGKITAATTITFSGAGGKWSMQDAFAGVWTITAGTVVTNGFTGTLTSVALTGTATKAFDFTNSTLNVAATGVAWNFPASATGTTITATGSTINFTGNPTSLVLGGPAGQTYGAIVITGGAATTAITGGAVTCTAFTYTGGASKTGTVTLASDLTVTGALTITPNSVVNRVAVASATIGTQRTITAGSISIATGVAFMDIAAAGASSPWDLSGIQSSDRLGNSNITFTTSAAQSYVGGDADWSWSDVTKWTSRVPLAQDDVTIGAVLTARTITADMPTLGRSISFAGTTGNPVLANTTPNSLFGSLTMAAGMTSSGTNALSLLGRSSHTLTSAAVTWTQHIIIGAPGGTYDLQDAMTVSRSSSGLGLSVQGGATLNTNGWTVGLTGATSRLTVNTASTLNAGASTFNLSDTAAEVVTVLNGVFNGPLATVNIVNASANERVFGTNGTTFTLGTLNYTVAASTGALRLSSTTGTNVFYAVNVTDASGPKSLTITSGTGLSIRHLAASGAAGRLITIAANPSGFAALLANLGGNWNVDYVNVTDITFAGPGNFYAGPTSHSTDGGNNTGVIFSAASDESKLDGAVI